ncbi:RusA family crossover junction endodeoxyribonuclease [Hominenteromicrobium mulieris]|uniref:RusA family crossover junction endodeoxyribonuclease n=1 Tax=Hominenteromicrobium TaxID=3073575 RepID=UPI002045574C|nr:MAG TPA_asm: Endodeoxyribonuclease RusA [Caudoviricetes sp.]
MKVTFTAPDKLAKKQTYTPDKIKEYEKLVRERFLEETQNSRFAEDALLEIYITVLAKMPKGATPEEQARMFNGRANNAKTPDLNKITKIVCEALEGVAYKDTVQITKVSAIKAWSVYPSVWVTIEGEERKSDGNT